MSILNKFNLLIKIDAYLTMPDPANPSRIPAHKGHKAKMLDMFILEYLKYAKEIAYVGISS